MRSPGAVLLIFSSLQGLQIFWSPFIVIHERKFSLAEFAAAIWASWLGQIVNWWAKPEYRVQQYINWAGSSSVSPCIICTNLENLMRRLNPDLTSSSAGPHSAPSLVFSSHSSTSNWIKKLLWRNFGPPLVSWKLILLTEREMSGTGLSSEPTSQLIWFNLIIIR